MSSNNTQVAPSGVGASGGPGNRTPVSNQVVLRKYGRGMNSPKFERRYMYLHIEPFANDLETGIWRALDALNTLLAIWRPPEKGGSFRPDMWWERIECPYCRRRAEYEIKKWQANEYAWYRRMCLRHWFVYHLTMITPAQPLDLLENRPISIVADDRTVLFNIETVNYKYSIRITKEVAVMEVNYKGSLYKFTYRNHLHGFPYISSYLNIVFDVHNTMRVFRDLLADYVAKRRLYCNVVINDFIALPPAQDTASNCPACKI